MTRTIEITFPLRGISTGKAGPRIETSGFQGAACKTATEAFERLFGGPQTEELKSEFYEVQEGVERLHQGGNSDGTSG